MPKVVALHANKPEAFIALRFWLIGFLLLTLWCSRAIGQQEVSSEDLVNQTQNPVADLIRVPFQNNFNFAAGPKHNHQIYLQNIQPVIPMHLTEEWNLIARIITPVINFNNRKQIVEKVKDV